MVPILSDEKRLAIGCRLADIKLMQEAMIEMEDMLIRESDDPDIRKRLMDFVNDDRKNLRIIENATIQYGVKGEPHGYIVKMLQHGREMLQDRDMNFYLKISQLELFKHQAAMSGIELHKAAQVVGADIDAAITPLNTVNFENRAHQEQLKGVKEVLSTRELTGQDPDQSLWARVQDSLAALTGVFGSVMSRGEGGAEMKVTDIVRMDHQKVNMLFAEIQGTNDPQKQIEFFNQLYTDLNAHANAEDETWYASLKNIPDAAERADYAYRDQDDLQAILEDVKNTGINSSDFRSKMARLQQEVTEHVNFEEAELFAKLRQHFSDEQLREMGRQFQAAKSRHQEQLQQRIQMSGSSM